MVAKPPIGCSTIKENGKRKIVINQTGKLLRKAFLWKANELVSNEEVRKQLLVLGVKATRSKNFRHLQKPFCCSLLVHNSLDGRMLEGSHEKLISKEIFLKVNEVQSANPHGFKMTVEHESISLKRFIRCEKCGSHMAGYMHIRLTRFITNAEQKVVE